MNTKKLSLIFLLLFASQMLFVSFATTSITLTENDNTMNMLEEQNFISETDLNRVETTIDVFENGDFESWNNPHEPSDLSVTRTQMVETQYEFTIVSEGARSGKMMAKGTDVDHPASSYLHMQSWSSLANPANLTVSFDYYIDAIANPNLGDRLELFLPFKYYYVHYFIGSNTSITNSTYHAYYELDTGPLQTWNTFERNVTQDYVDAFGSLPEELNRFVFYVRSYDFEYSTAFIDDVYFLNNTYVKVGGSINSGNFESGGSGSQWWGLNNDFGSGDVSQSSTRVEGDWSMNMTINSVGYVGSSSVRNSIDRRLTSINKDQFTLYWNIADWQDSSSYARAYMWVEYTNATHDELYVYYVFGADIASPSPGSSDDIVIIVDDFNTTGTWNLFNRSVMDDVHTRYPDADIFVDEIEFYAVSNGVDARISILFDDVSFVTSIIHDEGYEDQGAVGDPIIGWGSGFGSHPAFTVTDFSANGNKAANITLVDGDELWNYQAAASNMPLNENTELILDLDWYIESFNESSADFLMLTIIFDERTMSLPIMNSSAIDPDYWEFSETDIFVPQSETNTVGAWVNWQIDIVHTFEEYFGELPDTTLNGIELNSMTKAGSSFTVFLDDFYIYMDPEPEIIQVTQNPTVVDEAGDVVWITAEVVDATTELVTLSYRADSGAWVNVTMAETTDGIFTVEFHSPWGEIEYFVTATDAFGKTDVAMDGGDYFSFSTADTVAPMITIDPANGSTVEGVQYISINVIETGSGFAGSELFIEGVSLANNTAPSVGIAWDTTVISDGEYNITVVASDIAGNNAVVTHLMTVNNSVTTTTTTGTEVPQDFTGAILIIVVIVIIGAVAVIYIFVLKKK